MSNYINEVQSGVSCTHVEGNVCENIPTYKSGIRVKVQDKFIQGGMLYSKVDESKTAYLFEVLHESGSVHYEIVKKGHNYKQGNYASSSIKEGDEMYPLDNDFGVWAWCFSDAVYAHNNIHRLKERGM